MKLTIDDKTLRRILLVVAIVSVLLIFIFFRRRSAFIWSATSTEPNDAALTTRLNGYQDTYNTAMITINAMADGAAKTTAIMDAEKTLTTNINTAVGDYINGKCPEVTSGTAPASSDTAKTTAWNTYQSDLASIGTAYYTLIRNATASTTPSATEVLAARKADITGATRKYIATVCPDFYNTAAGNPTNTYKTWASYTTTAAAGAATIGFVADKITTTNVNTWLGYAAKTYTSSTSVAVSQGTTTAGPITLGDVTDLVAGTTQVQFNSQTVNRTTGAVTTNPSQMATIATVDSAAKTVTLTLATAPGASGIIIPANTVFAKALKTGSTSWNLGAATTPNWKLARDAGPGTIPVPTWATT